jgi:hypothetical protein
MATRKIAPPQRIDSDFEREMREIARIRLEKNLANLKPKELSISEMTRLLRRTNGYRLSLEELKTKPKRQ